MSYTITLNQKDYDLIVRCIHQGYLPYNGEYTDDEVYALNSQLDNLLYNVKMAVKNDETTQ